MKAFALDEFGRQGSVRELSDPEPEANEILLRVQAAGVNVIDAWVAQGDLKDVMEHRFPLIPGIEAAGIVEAAGSLAGGFSEGDKVYGVSTKPFFGAGTFAELATLPSDGVGRAPVGMDPVFAAGAPHTGLTALAVIDALDPQQGQKVLLVGATGGVGNYVLQLAATLGSTVISVAGARNADYARSLGAAETIDYAEGGLVDLVRARHPDGFDAIIDLFHDAPTLTQLSDLVRPGGPVISTNAAAQEQPLSQRGVRAVNLKRPSPARLNELTDLLDAGALRVPPTQVLPLDDAASALAQIQQRHVRGKLVIHVG